MGQGRDRKGGRGREAPGTALREWEDLPAFMRKEEVRPYYDALRRKGRELRLKRGFDVVLSAALAVLLLPVFAALALLVAADSRGGVFYRQVRVTRYGKKFRIWKFRTMEAGADRTGPQVTAAGDGRVTRAGAFLRRYRLDELPQLLNIMAGDMTFVGTRPEVPKYVRSYTPEMMATLLLPAGVTSRASVHYRDEAGLLSGAEDVDVAYVGQVLPAKMRYNLESLGRFGLLEECRVLALTVLAVFFGKERTG